MAARCSSSIQIRWPNPCRILVKKVSPCAKAGWLITQRNWRAERIEGVHLTGQAPEEGRVHYPWCMWQWLFQHTSAWKPTQLLVEFLGATEDSGGKIGHGRWLLHSGWEKTYRWLTTAWSGWTRAVWLHGSAATWCLKAETLLLLLCVHSWSSLVFSDVYVYILSPELQTSHRTCEHCPQHCTRQPRSATLYEQKQLTGWFPLPLVRSWWMCLKCTPHECLSLLRSLKVPLGLIFFTVWEIAYSTVFGTFTTKLG